MEHSLSASRVLGGSHEKLDRELAAFETLFREGKLAEYKDRYVAIHDGRVIDSDAYDFALAKRMAPLSKQQGAIAIRWVQPDGFILLSERLAGFSPEIESPFVEENGVD